MAERTSLRLVNALLVVVGLIAGSAAIRHFTPAPTIDYVTAKTAHLNESPDRYDILFAGSSRTYRQISPKVFDHRLKEHGVDVRSFNFGIPAAKTAEVWHLLNRLRSLEGVRPRYVFVDLDGLFIGIKSENAATEREVYWHGATETSMAIRSLAGADLRPRVEMSSLHAKAFLLRSFSVGRLRLLISQDLESGRLRRRFEGSLGPNGDGFVPFETGADQKVGARRQDFLDHLPRYRRLIRKQPEQFSKRDCLTASHADMLTRLKTAVEALGAEPIFILSPATRPRCEVHDAFREGLLPNLFAFDDAQQFPELYKIDSRFDFEHLDSKGAALFSRLLADRFASHMNADRGAQ